MTSFGSTGPCSSTGPGHDRGPLDAAAAQRPPSTYDEAHDTHRERERRAAELLQHAADAPDAALRRRLLDEVVLLHIDVARSIAARYQSRGIPNEDLQQVACFALVKAARGYRVGVGTSFLAYCTPTIRGEIKRYFRDHAWTVKPPRRTQDLQAMIRVEEGELSRSLGHPPGVDEMAEHLGVPVSDVREAMAAKGCYTPTSLDRPLNDDTAAGLVDRLPATDRDQQVAEARVVLAPVVRSLSHRDRQILRMRFFEGCTQQEIATDLGVTQMQVSRLLSRILRDLRRKLDPDGCQSAELRHGLGA